MPIIYIGYLLFIIGLLGIMLRKNIILMLISLELILLSISFIFIINSLNLDDIIGQNFSLYILTIAGGESAIGLAIIVVYYRIKGNIGLSS